MTASGAPAREALWSRARALSAAAGASISPRMRRLAIRGDRPLGLADLDHPPEWLEAEPGSRARLARLTGAVLVSRAWSREISGVVLGRAAQAVGEEALEDLINLPAVVAPQVADAQAAAGDPLALDRLGAGALIAAAEARLGLSDRLARLFPAGAAPGAKTSDAALAQRTAEGLGRQAAAEAAPAEAAA